MAKSDKIDTEMSFGVQIVVLLVAFAVAKSRKVNTEMSFGLQIVVVLVTFAVAKRGKIDTEISFGLQIATFLGRLRFLLKIVTCRKDFSHA